MKTLLLLGAVLFPPALSAQEFINLTFNEPDLSGPLIPVQPDDTRTPFLGNTSQIVRGWNLSGNGLPLSQIAYTTGSSLDPVTLIRRTDLGYPSGVNYELAFYSFPPNRTDLRLMQTGRIPDSAAGLALFSGGRMDVIVNGEVIFRTDTNGTGYPIVDVSRFAGQTVALEFHVVQGPAGASFLFDIGGFTQIPEPSTWALFAVGLAGLAWVVYEQNRS